LPLLRHGNCKNLKPPARHGFIGGWINRNFSNILDVQIQISKIDRAHRMRRAVRIIVNDMIGSSSQSTKTSSGSKTGQTTMSKTGDDDDVDVFAFDFCSYLFDDPS
jgi:hypothetical protein